MQDPSVATPVRLRLSRRKGFDLAALSHETNGLPVVNVARPGPLGNPFVVGLDGTAEDCKHAHGLMLAGHFSLLYSPTVADMTVARAAVLEGVAADTWRGHNVACWCAVGKPCHGDTLLAVFNRVRSAPADSAPVSP